MFDGGGARAHLVQLDRSWLEVACKHDTSPDVMRLLGEMSCASILLSASLKYEGSVILQIHGDGPVRLAVAECNAKLGFRSTIKMSETLEPTPGADWKALVNQNNLGRFSVVLDPKIDNQHPYQGIVPLHEAGVSQALESYMQRSEQLPTRLWLACNGERAAGLLLQKMPHQGGTNKKSDAQSEAATEASDDDWERLITLAQTVTAEELLSVEAETLLHRLFWQEAPKLLEDKAVQFSCSCSRVRVGRMLKTLGAEEVESILAEQGQVDVHCDFCNAAYHFDAVDCAALFTGEHPPSSEDPSTIH
jgi:molecular chaperone Hsp33